jgi:hypothetical protein
MYAGHRVVILIRRKNAGVSDHQYHNSGKKYIENKVRFIA